MTIRDRGEYKARVNELLSIPLARSVIVTIDMQRDYLDPVIGSNPFAADVARDLVENTARLLECGRAAGLPVIHCYVRRRAVEIEHGYSGTLLRRLSDAHELAQNALGAIRRGPDRLEGSPQAEIAPRLAGRDDLHVSSKKTMDSFLGTELEQLLRHVFDAEVVILAGVNTDTCVYATAFTAANLRLRPVVVSDCVGSTRGEDQSWMALELMSRTFAWVLTVEELEHKLRTASAAPARDAESASGARGR